MSVTTYEIGCNYRHPKLKNKVYFLSKSFFNPSTNSVTVHIDNGGASVSIVTHVPHPTPPNVIEGFGIKFTETESLDERYKFTKQLNISINGHLTDTTWLLENDYYIMVETIEGTFYLINVDFPSKMSFTYNLSNSQDQTDFVFTSNSNFPALKVNSVPWESFNTCKTYHVPGVDYLKLLEKDYATIDKENGVVNLFNSQTFKNIDYLKNTISLQETYDCNIATTTISFEIPFDDYKTSWQYNLLEFKQNLYVAQVGNINGNTIFAGFEHGLEPSYEINAATSNGEATSIKITLTEASNWGIFVYDSWSYYNVPEKKWIGVQSEYICLAFGVAGYTLMQEVDENGTPTGRYKCLAGEESRYSDYNIIDTYSEPESFPSPQCSRSMARGNNVVEYTCVDGDKYEVIAETVSYDNGKTYTQTEFHLGPLVETGSTWCLPPAEYKWVLDETQYTCATGETLERWVESGYTCEGYDAHTTYYKQLSYDSGETWVDTDPLETKEIVTECSDNCMSPYAKQYLTFEALEDCIFSLKPLGEPAGSLSGWNTDYSVDNGNTWNTLHPVNGYTPVLPSGSTIIFAGHWPQDMPVVGDYLCQFNSTGKFVAYGNLNSLAYGHDFLCKNFDNLTIRYALVKSSVVDVENLIYPSGTLFINCTELRRIVIPEVYSNLDGRMFSGCTSLASIGEIGSDASLEIPESVSYIGELVFVGCTGLTDVTLPNSVTSIEFAAFSGCTNLVDVNIGSGVTNLEWGCFEYCTSLSSIGEIGSGASLEIPESVSYIGTLAFYGCTGLTDVKLPDSVTTIGNNIFEECTSLMSVNIGSGLTNISKEAFLECYSLTGVILPSNLISIGDYAFCACTGLTSINIPTGVTSIGGSAFYDCRNLNDITTPNSVTSIGEAAFNSCTSLTSATIGSSCISIGNYGFLNCRNLTSIICLATTPPTLEHNIWGETYVFSGSSCPIYVPSGSVNDYQSSWGEYSHRIVGIQQYRWVESGYTCVGYDKCKNYIKEETTNSGKTWNIVIPVENSASTIIETYSIDCGYDPTTLFKAKLVLDDLSVINIPCSSESAITNDQVSAYSSSCVSAEIGECTTSLDKRCFYNFSNLTSITISDSVTEIGKEAFNGCNSLPVENNIRYADTYLMQAIDKTLSSYVIKSGTRFIGNIAFGSCTGMTNMTVPNSVISIGEGAFARCSGMTSLVLQEGLEKIDGYAFQNCRALTSVTLPSTLTFIGERGFHYCEALANITCLATTPPTIRAPFEDCHPDLVIYVPSGSVNTYKSTSGWSRYSSRIQAIP